MKLPVLNNLSDSTHSSDAAVVESPSPQRAVPRKAKARLPKPRWLKVKAPSGPRHKEIRKNLEGLKLFTVCQEAQCPNLGECWDGGTATIMLMGGICTRGCRFCAVTTGKPMPLDPLEPLHAARAVVQMGVDYIVLTSVDRDDLPDGGASHFAACVDELKRLKPELLVEVLIGDFAGRLGDVDTLVDAGCEVIAHNMETVKRLTRRVRDVRAKYDQSLKVLAHIKTAGKDCSFNGGDILSKTSLMMGLGESEAEVIECLQDLRGVGCDVVTFGQYLQPSQKHIAVAEYVTPEQFDRYGDIAREMGFLYVASGPLVRSSYKAGEYYLKAHLDKARALRGGQLGAVK